jgi:hypothetical protein
LVLAQAQRPDELLVQNLTGMERGELLRSHDGLLMVIHDLDAVGIPILPEETNPPLIVDPNAVLTFAVTFQSLKAVGRRRLQIFKGTSPLKHPEFSKSHPLNILRKLSRNLTMEQPLRLFVLEVLDHGFIL